MIIQRKFIIISCAIIGTAFQVLYGAYKAPSSSTSSWVAPSKIEKRSSHDDIWNSLRSNTLDNSKPYTLAELIDMALRNSPSTKQAWEQAKTAEAVKKKAKSAYFPNISIGANVTKIKTAANVAIADADYTKQSPTANLTFLLLDLGGRCASVKEVSELLISANYAFNQVLQDIVLAVVTSYYDLYSARSAVDAAQSDVDNSFAVFDAAQSKYKIGVGTKLDMLQARAVYEHNLYLLEAAKGTALTAKAELARILGYPAYTNFNIIISTEIPNDITDDDISSVINEALEKRQDIASLRAKVRAQEAGVKAAGSNIFPTLNLMGTYQEDKYDYSSNAQLLENDKTYAATVNLNWDIFDGFGNINALRQQKAVLELVKTQLKEAEINASAQVWTSYFNFKTALKKYAAGKTLLDTTVSAYEMALESYKAGLKNILDLTNAESNLSKARSNYIASKRDLFVALAQLAHATGKINTAYGEKENEKNQ